MEQKIKYIMVGLIGFAIIFFFLFVSAATSKKRILRERDELKNEVALLNSNLEKLNSDLSTRQDKINSMRRELDAVHKEMSEAQKKYEAANREKDELTQKLKALQEKKAPAAQPTAGSQAEEAYWAGILKGKTNLEMQLANIRDELKSTQINNEQLQRDKSALELDINNLKREKDDLKREVEYTKKQFDYNQKILDGLSLQTVVEKNDKMKIQETLNAVRSENTILRSQLRNLTNRKISLERKMVELQSQVNDFKNRSNEMDIMLQEKMMQIQKLKSQMYSGVSEPEGKESVELPPIIVRPGLDSQSSMQAQETPAFLDGAVLAVNRENNFVIIDLGETSGIKQGDVFNVYRGEEKIAGIEAIKVSKTVSACDIKLETKPIKIGDRIK